MRDVCARPVEGVHLVAEGLDVCVGEEGGQAVARAVPDYVWWIGVVPLCDFLENCRGGVGGGEVVGKGEEALGGGVGGCGLYRRKSGCELCFITGHDDDVGASSGKLAC